MPASPQLTALRARLVPFRQALLTHPIYPRLNSIAALHSFMQHHVFAVWDFMSLLKALQQRLCCVVTPWVPPQDGAACRLINEIVLGEESDDDGAGGFGSHFELYRRAMHRCGADTRWIDRFLDGVGRGQTVATALSIAEVPEAVRPFVAHTFQIIDSGDLASIASAFAFGREDLLPEVFQQIVEHLNARVGGELEEFKFYLARHIELDGDEHGPMAEQLVERLCGTDDRRWQAATDAAIGSLEARRQLWDSVCQCLPDYAT